MGTMNLWRKRDTSLSYNFVCHIVLTISLAKKSVHIRISFGAHFLNKKRSLVTIGMRDTLFDNITGELMLRQNQHFALQLLYDATFVLGIAVFEHMLNHIVAILILHEFLGIAVQFFENRGRLLLHTVLQYALNNATPVRMRGQVVHLLEHVRHDEVNGLGIAAFDTLLNNVISVLILDTLDDVALELARHLDEKAHLILVAYRLQRLLDDPTAVHLECECEHVTAQSLRECGLVFGGAEFKEFLKIKLENTILIGVQMIYTKKRSIA